jgi:hypothetical protein
VKHLGFLVAVAAACGSSGGPPSGHGTPDAPSQGGPTFLTFGTNLTTVHAGDTVVFSAVLTSPADDPLVGGTLVDETGAIQYGAFQSGAEKGSFGLSLTWDAIGQVQPLTFMTTDQRTFVAQFFTSDGAKASKTVMLTFTCDGKSACDGACYDLTSDEHNCGTCGHVCDYSLGQPTCDTGVCVGERATAQPTSCHDVCAADGLTCTPSCLVAGSSGSPWAVSYFTNDLVEHDSTSCTDAPPATNFRNETCCCTH